MQILKLVNGIRIDIVIMENSAIDDVSSDVLRRNAAGVDVAVIVSLFLIKQTCDVAMEKVTLVSNKFIC